MSRNRNSRKLKREVDKGAAKVIKADKQRDRYNRTLPDRNIPKDSIDNFKARTPNQEELIWSIHDNNLTFVLGSPGSGKTFVSASMAVKFLLSGEVERIVCIRPIVEASTQAGRSSLGFLPGDEQAKLGPYVRPLMKAIGRYFSETEYKKLRGGKFPTIEFATLETLRGENLDKCFCILDEAENCSMAQLKLLLTRIGEGSVFVITGDEKQSDLPQHLQGGLEYYANKLQEVDGVGLIRMTEEDIVRSGFLRRIMPYL